MHFFQDDQQCHEEYSAEMFIRGLKLKKAQINLHLKLPSQAQPTLLRHKAIHRSAVELP